MRAMGIDVSTYTGIAVVGDIEKTKLVHFKTEKGFERLQLIANGVRSALEAWKPDIVMIEGYGYGNRNTLVLLVELGTTVRQVVYDAKIVWHDVAPTSLKKFVTGRGTATKPEMALHVTQRWGFVSPSGSDDVVDAYGLAQMGLALLKNGVKK